MCDCYFKWFPKWLNETGVSGCSATCAHPESLKNRHVQSVAYQSYTCDDFPKPYIIRQPETQITLKGNNLTLFCRAASTSPADMTFQWKVDEMDLLFNPCDDGEAKKTCVVNRAHSFDGKGREITSELRLTNTDYDDAGKYQCVVSNKFGTTYSDRANITVYVFPTFVQTPRNVTVKGKGISYLLPLFPKKTTILFNNHVSFKAAREKMRRFYSHPRDLLFQNDV